jgi:hypothetical protein
VTVTLRPAVPVLVIVLTVPLPSDTRVAARSTAVPPCVVSVPDLSQVSVPSPRAQEMLPDDVPPRGPVTFQLSADAATGSHVRATRAIIAFFIASLLVTRHRWG